MHIYGHDSCQRTCVLPFGGKSSEIAGLRRVVVDQLKAWGTPGLTDLTALAVTELAANVVKHVGEGTPAALLVNFDGSHLNLELHDTSAKLPTLQHVSADEESGRGLALLGAISTEWGSVPTSTGKVVWCQLAPESGAIAATTRRRVQRAAAILDAYGRECNGGSAVPTLNAMVQEHLAAYLIADLLHSFSMRGIDPAELLDRAQAHFEVEAAGCDDR